MADDIFERWATAQAPHVIADAQAQALELARRRLRDRFAEALLAAVERSVADASRREPEPPASEPPASEPPTSAPPLLWVYGIVPASTDRAPEAEGVEGGELGLVRHEGLAALVSPVSRARFDEKALAARLEDLPTLEALARAHDGVLEAAFRAGDVVPFRMCTLYDSAESLVDMLRDRAEELADGLARVEGKEEWGVKAFLEGEPTEDDADRPRSGTEYLARRRDRRDLLEATREAAETVVAEIHARLADRAAAAVLSRPQDSKLTGRGEMVLNGAYLVPREGVEDFLALADELRTRHGADGLVVELTGPWPAYHFVGGAPE